MESAKDLIMLIYTHQKSRKRKPTAKQRQLQADWEALVQKHTPKKVVSRSKVEPYTPPKVYVRETPHYPSLITNKPAACTKPTKGVTYTGSNMLGIATMHKSNAVPVFSAEEALETARMRRG